MTQSETTVVKQRAIQKKQDGADKARPASKGRSEAPPKTTARSYPARHPAQHLRKPGNEHELKERPKFEAPDYRGSGKLAGFTALITGADSGIGRAVAVLYAREGADVAIVYLDEHKDAEETARWVEKEGRECPLIAGDVKDPAFCNGAVERAVKRFGKLDVLVNNAAFQGHSQSIEDITDEQCLGSVHAQCPDQRCSGAFVFSPTSIGHRCRCGAFVGGGRYRARMTVTNFNGHGITALLPTRTAASCRLR